MSVFKSITPNDIFITPFEVHKNYSFQSVYASSSYGIQVYGGEYKWWKTNQADLDNNDVDLLYKTTNDKYEYVMHDSINHMFYDKFRYNPINTLSQTNVNQYRDLHKNVKIISVPQNLFGEKIREGTVNILDYTAPINSASSLITDNFFVDVNSNWYQGSYNTTASIEFTMGPRVFSPISASGEGQPKTMWFTSKLTDDSGSASWVEQIFLTSSINNQISSDRCYKLIIDIDGTSNYYPAPNLINTSSIIDPAITTMSIDITGSAGGLQTIYIPLTRQKYEFELYPTIDLTDANIIIKASQSINLSNPLSAENCYNLMNQSCFSVVFNEISLYERPISGTARQYLDDGNGNLYDTTSDVSIIDDTEEHLVGNWPFIDGYIDPRDDRRGNITSDKSIYMNHGICTDVEFVNGVYGTSAKFNKVNPTSTLIYASQSFSITNQTNIVSASSFNDLNNLLQSSSSYNPLMETYYIPVPNNYPSYALTRFYATSSANDIMVSPTVTLADDSLYRLSFWARNSYNQSDYVPKINIAVISQTSASLINAIQELNGHWQKHELYFTASNGDYHAELDFNLDANIIDQFPGGIDNWSEIIYVSQIKLETVKQINNIRVYNNDIFNFNTWEKFAVECIVSTPYSQFDVLSGDHNVILTKNGRRRDYINNLQDSQSIHNSTSGSSYYLLSDEMNVDVTGRYPYQISILNQNSTGSGLVRASRNNGSVELELFSSTVINDGNPHHILFQKTGSTLELYVDGELESSVTDFANEIFDDCSDRRNIVSVNNESDLFFGSRGDEKYVLRGTIECARIYNTAYNATDAQLLYQQQIIDKSYYYRVGNVFYEHGFITMTNPYDRYEDSFINTGSTSILDSGFYASMQGNLTLYEVEVHCPIEAGEYNHTFNRTCRTRGDINSERLACFTTHSQFTPYVTTVGLYNENAELVAVGKLSKPIKKINNIDTTFIVKFDV